MNLAIKNIQTKCQVIELKQEFTLLGQDLS